MNCIEISTMENVRSFVECVQGDDEPVVLFDGEDECLIAMRPAVFERILFDTDLLNRHDRSTFHV